MSARAESDAVRLARAGIIDVAKAEALLAEVDLDLGTLSLAADPDYAIQAVADLVQAHPDIRSDLRVPEFQRRLMLVVGASRALAEHLIRFPESRRWLTCIDPREAISRMNPGAGASIDASAHVRLAYRDALVAIAANDLDGDQGYEATSRSLSAAADAVLQAALESACIENPEAAREVTLAVIAMGKTGGRELNYISDVDVIFVGRPAQGVAEDRAMRAGATIASALINFCDAQTEWGTIWPVDAALRPEGKDGPLVRTVESHRAYYERWARTWEFQALLKARFSAGDAGLGAEYLEAVAPMVWQAAGRDDFVADVQAMRRKVEEHIPAKEAARQIKLGVGGLRDVEFAVQLLQLVHGKAESQLRTANTVDALHALRDSGLVGREDADQLTDAYIWLRTVEHRIQLHRLRRTHLMPEADSEIRRIARSLGFASVAEFMDRWRETAALIRRIHEKLFYRPLLSAVARLGADELRLTPEAARQRLQALGYHNPQGALAHLEALTQGVSRRAAIQRALLPAMLGWFADGPDPDAGLLGFRQLSDALGETPWYLRTLRDSGAAAQRLARVLSSSRYATELLLRAPEAAAMLEGDEDLEPRERGALLREVRAVVSRHPDPVSAIEAVRAVRRRELFRISVADLVGAIDIDRVGPALTDVAIATLEGALEAATRAVVPESAAAPTAMAVIAMGRLGGGEMSYPSDADLLFVHQPRPETDAKLATDTAMAIAAEMRRLCALPSPEPPLLIDADLRPEGRDGPLVRTLDSYASYYEQWAEIWERQALLRAAPAVGDGELTADFLAMADAHRYGTFAEADLREVRRIKARVEAERLPRGADPLRHVKLGPGGLSDVEWLAQLLQLQHGASLTALRSPSTTTVLREASAAGLLTSSDRAVLEDSWRLASRIRNAIMLVRGRPGDELPRDARDLRAVAMVLGLRTGGELLELWQATSRRARAVFERSFFGA